jgi:serine/threonine-protein kinase
LSLPSARRLNQDDTVPAEPKSLLCPQCKQKWPEESAPVACPQHGLALVRPRDLVDPGDDPMVGRTLEGRYTILARIGAGSMGTVYRARQHAMGREVAIKILRGDRAADESAKARFMREARANSLLASPNTVTVFDFGQSGSGEFYLAMEILEGESLGQRLQRVGRLSAPIAVDAARQALRSLGEAHAKGIIHRDLKPDNLFFARVMTGPSAAPGHPGSGPGDAHEEIVKVLDFGIAKMLNPDDPHPMNVVETQAGTVFGTPRYMSPEQAQGKPLDPRSDLYSLGVILYQMLTGRPPFTDNDAVVVMARHIKSTPKRPNEANPEANVPKELEDVVMRALAKDPNDRPASAEVLAGELLAALEAQGALTSGVRASITNAAGIRVPESMRPPPMPLPQPKRGFARAFGKVPLVAIVAPAAVLVAVAAVVFFLLSRRASPEAGDDTATADPAASATSPSTSTSGATVGEPAGEIAPVAPSAVTTMELPDTTGPETPAVTPDSLPPASGATASGTAAPATTGGRVRHAGGRHGASKSPPANASSAPSAKTPYGIFEN